MDVRLRRFRDPGPRGAAAVPRAAGRRRRGRGRVPRPAVADGRPVQRRALPLPRPAGRGVVFAGERRDDGRHAVDRRARGKPSNCRGYDSQIAYSKVLETHPDCTLQPVSGTVPIIWYHVYPGIPAADKCFDPATNLNAEWSEWRCLGGVVERQRRSLWLAGLDRSSFDLLARLDPAPRRRPPRLAVPAAAPARCRSAAWTTCAAAPSRARCRSAAWTTCAAPSSAPWTTRAATSGSARTMAPSMEALPAENLAEVVLYLFSLKASAEIFSLRCASTFCRDAVRRGIAAYCPGRPGPGNINVVEIGKNWRDDARPVEARGRIFGHACRILSFYAERSYDAPGATEKGKKIALNALRSFVADTDGALDLISLGKSAISVDELLEICRKSPRLTRLHVKESPLLKQTSYESIDKFAAAVSQACPSLEVVDFVSLNVLKPQASPAEVYAMHFPNLKRLSIGCPHRDPYVPVDYDRIAASAERCRATECGLTECHVSNRLMATLVGTSMASRLQILSLDYARMTAETVLAAATGFTCLRELCLRTSSDMYDEVMQRKAPAFFESLSRARPELERLHVDLRWQNRHTNDLCLRWIAKLSLVHLTLVEDVHVKFTSAGIDAILSGPCSQTLDYLDGFDATLPGSELLRLLHGCPKLKIVDLDGYMQDGMDECEDLLRGRGGCLDENGYVSFGYDSDGEPTGE